MSRLTIYILTKDRPALFCEALDSVLEQSCNGYDVVVSDNSDGDDTEAIVTSRYPLVTYVRRSPPLAPLSHFKAVFEECRSEYAVLFHDDDLMDRDYVRRMSEALDQHPSVGAVGCNAKVMMDDVVTERLFMGRFDQSVLISSCADLLSPYLGIRSQGHAPFPSYMYRSASIKGLYLDSDDGGKYSDVSFLMKVQQRAPMLWIPDALMVYRFHASNDSRREGVAGRLKLLRFIYRTTDIGKQHELVREFKFRFYLRWWLESTKAGRSRTPRRYRVVLKYLLGVGPSIVFFNGELWRRLATKLRPRFLDTRITCGR
jgi:glycosyltransferase involved in cell wall biosynthesis